MADIIPIDDIAQARVACRAEMDRRGLSIKRASREIGVSSSRLSRWLAEKYTGDVPRVTALVGAWLTTAQESAARSLEAAGLDVFAETGSASEVMDALACAQANGDMALVYGPSGRGKTRAAEHYCATNAGVVRMEATEAMSTMAGFLGCVAEALGGHRDHGSGLEAERAIIDDLRGRRALLIIDQAHTLKPFLLNELCSIRNISRAGVALIGEEKLRGAVARCPSILGRIAMRVDLRVLPAADVAAIAAGPLRRQPSAAETRRLTRAASGDSGLHTLRRILADAWRLARYEGRDGIDADCLRTAIESVIEQEGSDAADETARKVA